MKVKRLNLDLKRYIINKIIPKYNYFDNAHGKDHVEEVINRSLDIAKNFEVNLDMVYTIAAFHDLGLEKGRDEHEKRSSEILLLDNNLKKWFTEDEIKTMADAVEDHRASLEYEPRTIYGKIISEADRIIDPYRTIERTIKFGLDNFPNLTKEQQFERAYNYLVKKYSTSGYIKIWIPNSDNSRKLKEFQKLLNNRDKFIETFNKIFNKISYESNK